MNRNELVERYLDIAVREGHFSSRRTARFYLNYVFQDVSFVERSMLDIGGGSGLLSLYAASMGAKPVICLEPELEGSKKEVSDEFKRLSEAFSLDSASFQSVTFQDFDPGDQTFDIILFSD